MKKFFLSLGIVSASLVFAGCGSPSTSNIVDDADAEKLAEYEKALAEADALTEGYEGTP